MKIYYLPRFERQYKKLSEQLKTAAKEREILFRDNPFDPRLKLHELSGKLDGQWAFSVTYSLRIILEFTDKNTVWFYQIGDHDIYD